MTTRGTSRGFTLIEMMVAVALFAVVMVIATGSLLALVDANRKAQALQSVMENLNVALDGMVRSARQGTAFHCGSTGYATAQDCAQTSDSPSNHYVFAFEPYGGNPGSAADQRVYEFIPPAGGSGGYLRRSVNGGSSWVRITAPEVSITDMRFYVVGSARGTTGDLVQPKVVIVVKGIAGADKVKTTTTFSIQATAVQRVLDI